MRKFAKNWMITLNSILPMRLKRLQNINSKNSRSNWWLTGNKIANGITRTASQNAPETASQTDEKLMQIPEKIQQFVDKFRLRQYIINIEYQKTINFLDGTTNQTVIFSTQKRSKINDNANNWKLWCYRWSQV